MRFNYESTPDVDTVKNNRQVYFIRVRAEFVHTVDLQKQDESPLVYTK